MFSALALFVIAAAALHSPLEGKMCVPAKSTASLLGKVNHQQNYSVISYTTRAMAYTDYTKKMEAFIQIVTGSDGSMTNITTISDGNQMKTYEIYPASKKCTVRDLADSRLFKQYCVGDDDLKPLGHLTVGGKNAFIFKLPFHNESMTATYIEEDMTPVTAFIQQNYYGAKQIMSFQYGNVTDSVEDDSVFNIPSYCKTKRALPRRRCGPKQWEGNAYGHTVRMEFGKTFIYPTVLSISRDFIGKKTSSLTTVTVNGINYTTKTITNYNEQKKYSINMNKKTCTLSSPAVPNMVESCNDVEGLRLVDSFTVAGQEAEIYEMKVKSSIVTTTVFKESFQVISTVVENVLATAAGGVTHISMQYGNITTGIADPTVFDVPTYCDHGIFG